MDQKAVSISWGSLWKVVMMLLLVVTLYVARDILIALFLAIIISSALDPIVTWMEKRRIPRLLGTLAIYIVLIFMIALLAYAVVPIALSELNVLLGSLSQYSGTLFDFIDTSGFIDSVNQALGKITNLLLSGSTSVLEIGTKFLGGLTATVSVFVLSFYLTVGKDGAEKFLLTILPSVYESKTVLLYRRIKKKIGNWLAGQVVLSLAVGLLVFLGLWILGVKYSLILGILAGIFELIPYVGPIFSGSLAVLVALTDSAPLGFYVLILFIIIQQLENNVLVPAVTNLTTALQPVVILIALLIGAKVFGFLGLVLAVPSAVLLQEFLDDWSESKARRRGLGL
ncbi:MAG: AI-2E family transporter [bacterium]|nr:AI-2E family transporter [bacterium]